MQVMVFFFICLLLTGCNRENNTLTDAVIPDETEKPEKPGNPEDPESPEDLEFTVSPVENVIELDANAATRKIIVTRRDKDVQLTVTRVGDAWLRINPIEEDTANPLVASFDIQVFENTDRLPRTGKVMIKSSGMSYEYVINQSDTKDELPFTVEIKYNGAVLGDELRVPAKASGGRLEVTNSTGRVEEDGTLYLRAAHGDAWAKINHEWSLYDPDAIYHGRSQSLLEFGENIGEERQMIAEFYSRKSGKVYHRTTFIQAASSDYLNLSSTSLDVDRFGNIYDEPFALQVQSNAVWELKCAASWITVNYIVGTRSQIVKIVVDENQTGQPRSAQLEFVADGNVVRTFPITQSVDESATFTLKYELNLELNTIENRFMSYLPTTHAVYYANDVQIYNPGTSSNGDETIKIRANGTYGFVADAPATFNKLMVSNIRDRLLVYPGYRGVATNQYNGGGITVANTKYAQSFFRQIRYNLPIPGGVKRTQKVVYKILINNLTGNAQHDTPIITYTLSPIVSQ